MKPRMMPMAWVGLLVLMGTTQEARPQGSVEEALDRSQEALAEGKTQEAIAELLGAIRQQQEVIRGLEAASKSQRDSFRQQEESLAVLRQRLTDQESIIEDQRATIAEYEERLKKTESAGKTTVAAVEEVREIEDMYQRAYLTRRTGIFDVRRRDAAPYFRKAVEQFGHIAETYPDSRRAPDAQLQVARTYHRWLNDTERAIQAYKDLAEKWPDSPFAAEAREALSELGVPTAP